MPSRFVADAERNRARIQPGFLFLSFYVCIGAKLNGRGGSLVDVVDVEVCAISGAAPEEPVFSPKTGPGTQPIAVPAPRFSCFCDLFGLRRSFIAEWTHHFI